MIYNAGKVLSYLGSYLVDPLVEEFGWRRITFTLGLMNGLGLVLSAFATSATYIFFSFSLLVGVPSDMFVTILYAIVPQYFRRRMTLATSLMATGASCSLIVMPVIVTELATTFGFRIAAMITGALSLNCCAASMVFHPVEWHSKTPHSIPSSVTKTEKRKVISSFEKVAKTAKDNLGLLKSAMMMAAFGVGTAVFFTSYSLVVVELLGLPMLTPVLSVAGLFKGSLTIIFGPVFGK
ncbi:hypothetical protein O3P69_019037 [Scylla paramamosain]|uniref:Monocarboxylate transporter n=1 Tax=Scylla paramamosain TaxID=85552 RepID=A0AAW0T7S5_SCYPA